MPQDVVFAGQSLIQIETTLLLASLLYNIDHGEQSSPSPNLSTAYAVQYLIPISCRILATSTHRKSGNENEHHEIIIMSPIKR